MTRLLRLWAARLLLAIANVFACVARKVVPRCYTCDFGDPQEHREA
jgi:hypothetical protein